MARLNMSPTGREAGTPSPPEEGLLGTAAQETADAGAAVQPEAPATTGAQRVERVDLVAEGAEAELSALQETVHHTTETLQRQDVLDRLNGLSAEARDKLWNRLELLALLFGATAGGSGAFSFITEKLGTGKFQIGHVGLVMAAAALCADVAFGITRYINGKRMRKRYGG